MVISFSRERTAVRHSLDRDRDRSTGPGLTRRVALRAMGAAIASTSVAGAPMAWAQQGPQNGRLLDAFRVGDGQWRAMVFVSLSMPMGSLVPLAREAARGGIPLILAGPMGEGFDLARTQQRIREVTELCCEKRPSPAWQINPKQFAAYGIREVPAFVLSRGESVTEFTKLAGDMPLGTALLSIAQRARIAGAAQAAAEVREKIFATR